MASDTASDQRRGGFVAVLAQVWQKWRTTGADRGGVGRTGLRLPEYVFRGVSEVSGSESFDPGDAGVVGLAQTLVCTVLVDVIADRRTCFDRGEKGAMTWRHVVTHVEEVRAQRIIAVPHTQCRVERGDNRALCAGLACELLRSPGEDALVDQPVGH